jgi:hypothetical protein
MYYIQHCFICRPSDSTVSEDAGIEPRTVTTTALAVRRSNHSARSHPHSARSHPHSARSHPHSVRSHPHSARSHPHSARSHPHSAGSHPHSASSHPHSASSHPHSARSHPHSARSHPHSARSHPGCKLFSCLKAEEKEGKALTVIKLSELREEDEEERTEDILVGKRSSVPISICQCWGIRDILVQIRILGYVPTSD